MLYYPGQKHTLCKFKKKLEKTLDNMKKVYYHNYCLFSAFGFKYAIAKKEGKYQMERVNIPYSGDNMPCNFGVEACITFKLNITELLAAPEFSHAEVISSCTAENPNNSRKLYYLLKTGDCAFDCLGLDPSEKAAIASQIMNDQRSNSYYFILNTRYGETVFIDRYVNTFGIGIILIPDADTVKAIHRVLKRRSDIVPSLFDGMYEGLITSRLRRFFILVNRSVMFGYAENDDVISCYRHTILEALYSISELLGIHINVLRLMEKTEIELSPQLFTVLAYLSLSAAKAVMKSKSFSRENCESNDDYMPEFSFESKGSVDAFICTVPFPESLLVDSATGMLTNPWSKFKELGAIKDIMQLNNTIMVYNIIKSKIGGNESPERTIYRLTYELTLSKFDPSVIGLKHPDPDFFGF